MLAEQEEQLAWVGAGPLRDSQRSRLVNRVDAVELFLCHRVHHEDELPDPVCRLLLLALRNHIRVEPWDHANNVAQGAHVQHAAELVTHVPQRELARLDLVNDVFLLAS